MRTYLLIALLAVGSVAACVPKGDGTPQQLASACQIVKCVCSETKSSFLPTFGGKEPADVIWQPDGKASCPPGYVLERKDARSIYDRPLY